MKKSSSPKNSQLSTFNSQLFSGAGFTLIELLIVIGIIGIMAAGLMYLINPLGQIQKANDAKRKSDLEQLQRTLETYYNDNGSYPPSSISTTTGCTDAAPGNAPAAYHIFPSTGCIGWGLSWGPYNTTLPRDPSSSRYYVYFSTGQSYWLYASLERGGSDPQACYSSGAACANVGAQGIASTCGATCNYGVSSPNTSP